MRALTLIVFSAAILQADSTALDIRGVTYPGPNCEPPVVRTLALAPHFTDASYYVDFEVVIGDSGIPRITGTLNTHLPFGRWRALRAQGISGNTEEGVYGDVYKAIARAVLENSRFEPAVCGGQRTAVAAAVRFRFDVEGRQEPGPAPGCSDPVVIYKPPSPDDRRGPPARITVGIVVDDSGRVTPVSFHPAEVQPGPVVRGLDWQAEYERLIRENLARWKMRPASCNGQPVKKAADVTFNFHWRVGE